MASPTTPTAGPSTAVVSTGTMTSICAWAGRTSGVMPTAELLTPATTPTGDGQLWKSPMAARAVGPGPTGRPRRRSTPPTTTSIWRVIRPSRGLTPPQQRQSPVSLPPPRLAVVVFPLGFTPTVAFSGCTISAPSTSLWRTKAHPARLATVSLPRPGPMLSLVLAG